MNDLNETFFNKSFLNNKNTILAKTIVKNLNKKIPIYQNF